MFWASAASWSLRASPESGAGWSSNVRVTAGVNGEFDQRDAAGGPAIYHSQEATIVRGWVRQAFYAWVHGIARSGGRHRRPCCCALWRLGFRLPRAGG